MESQFRAGREKKRIDHEIELLTYLDDGAACYCDLESLEVIRMKMLKFKENV